MYHKDITTCIITLHHETSPNDSYIITRVLDGYIELRPLRYYTAAKTYKVLRQMLDYRRAGYAVCILKCDIPGEIDAVTKQTYSKILYELGE